MTPPCGLKRVYVNLHCYHDLLPFAVHLYLGIHRLSFTVCLPLLHLPVHFYSYLFTFDFLPVMKCYLRFVTRCFSPSLCLPSPFLLSHRQSQFTFYLLAVTFAGLPLTLPLLSHFTFIFTCYLVPLPPPFSFTSFCFTLYHLRVISIFVFSHFTFHHFTLYRLRGWVRAWWWWWWCVWCVCVGGRGGGGGVLPN